MILCKQPFSIPEDLAPEILLPLGLGLNGQVSTLYSGVWPNKFLCMVF